MAGLRSDNAVIKSKSIIAARELLVAPEKHIQCIAAGITPALRDLLVQQAAASTAAEGAPSDVPDLQAATAATLQLLVAKEVGCRDALQHGCLPHVLQLLKQPSTAVRDAVYGCLRAAAMYEPWRTALVREGALPALLMYAQQEEPQRAAWALELLHHCTQVRACAVGPSRAPQVQLQAHAWIWVKVSQVQLVTDRSAGADRPHGCAGHLAHVTLLCVSCRPGTTWTR